MALAVGSSSGEASPSLIDNVEPCSKAQTPIFFAMPAFRSAQVGPSRVVPSSVAATLQHPPITILVYTFLPPRCKVETVN